MKVILLKDVDSLGQAGEIVQVADGFARNALIPQHNAVIATDVNVAQYESRRRLDDAAADREQRGAAELAQTLEKTSITAQVKVGEDDRLFGSVTAQNIADLLKEQGHDIDRRKVDLDEPIRSLGVYTVALRLHPEVTAMVKLWIVKE